MKFFLFCPPPSKDKDTLMRYKDRWEESDTDKKDNKLTKSEFLKFRHPEHRDDSMQEMAGSIIHGLGKVHFE